MPAYANDMHTTNALSSSKESACSAGGLQETQAWSLSWEDLLEEEMATHSRILAWRIPCTEEPGEL